MAQDNKKTWNDSLLSEQELLDFKFVKERIEELKEARKEEQFGVKLESIWQNADKDYAPHRLKTVGKKVLAEDEEKGWRGVSSFVQLGAQDWQSDISQANPFVKIQTALSILIDQNPTGIFTAKSKKFENTTNLIKQLYQRSWDYSKSKQQLKLFVFNLAKYGWAIGRTYPLKISRTVSNLVEYNEENPSKSKYEKKDVVEFNDIFRENIDPWNAWIDDMAKPNNNFTVRDWTWRKVYSMDLAKEEFGNWPNWKYVEKGGTVTDKIDENDKISKKFKDKNLVEVYFYENRIKDLFVVIVNKVPVIISPLPISDSVGNKKLSLWQTYWNLRHAECPYGVGIYEAIRYDQGILDRIRNMTIDQLTMSIYKMFFYQGTNQLTETGDIKIAPGVGKQTLDPKNINWLEIPGPGADAWNGIQMFRHDLDESSGITDPLLGQVTGKTAFEIAQAKEAALKRLKTPLENITDALETEGYITVSLMQLLYSIPEVYNISDPKLVDQYLQEIQSDPELYQRDEGGNFQAKVFPEFPLNLDKNEQGDLIETNETRFFRIKPRFLKWEGIVNIKAQSVLTPSKQVDKALSLEMWNMLIPLFAQPPELYLKAAKDIAKQYDRDPDDVLPDGWLNPPQQAEEPLFIPADQAQMSQGGMPSLNQAPQAQKLVPSTTIPQRPQSLVGKIASRLSQPFR